MDGIYKPDLDYIQHKANFLTFEDEPAPNSSQIGKTYAQSVIDKHTQDIEAKFKYYGLTLPTEANNLAVMPAKDLIACGVILELVDSYLNESERSQVWRANVKDADKAFREMASFYTSQRAQAQITSGFCPARRINTRA